MKKSYKVINGVLGYLKGEAGYEKQIDKKFLDKNERLAFQKKADYFKIFSIIRNCQLYLEKQAGNQKRWL